MDVHAPQPIRAMFPNMAPFDQNAKELCKCALDVSREQGRDYNALLFMWPEKRQEVTEDDEEHVAPCP